MRRDQRPPQQFPHRAGGVSAHDGAGIRGRYLFDKPRELLYELARSENLWERRTAIVATSYFIRQGDVADTFEIAEILFTTTMT